MKNKTAKLLIIGIICIFVLCVVIFSLMTYRMNKRSADAIGELASLYMSDMSEQAAAHFGTTIELRFSQVSALVDAVPPSEDSEKTEIALRYNARLRGFNHLALCNDNGDFEMIDGSMIYVDNPDSFIKNLRNGEESMSVGRDESGRELVLMGIPAAYPMDDGQKSIAIIATLSTTYISETLSIDADEEMIYYFIINRDGDFIIKDKDIPDENYFQRVYDRYEDINGMTADQYLDELKSAMDYNINYANEFVIEGDRGKERRFLYCASLPFSDWYLLLFMPYGQFDRTVNALGSSWILAAVLSCLSILVALGALFFLYIKDMRKQVRELREARRLAENASKAKSEFLSNMSHDIRTPMNGIVGMTAIAIANIDNIQQVKNCLKKIDLSSRHLLGLINDILDMSKIESGKLELHPEKLSLPETIKNIVNVVQPQATAKQQRFEVYVKNITCEHIECDGVRFSQILFNLLGNSVKFTPEGGEIGMSCYEEDSDKGDDFVRVHIDVKDTGIGMTEEFITKIFDAFAREDTGRVQKTEGSGLGMAITKYIVDAMQGTIEVESKLNVGSEFKVVLDVKKVADEDKGINLPNKNVLVAAKDKLICDNAAATLESMGCRAERVFDGETAIKAVRERDGGFDFILLDIELSGMEDFSLAREISEASKGVGIILLLTVSDWSNIENAAKAAGISGVIYKPLFRSNLYSGLIDYSSNEEVSDETSQKYDFTGKKILLAEDNDLNREIAVELLSEIGLEIDSAEAVEKFINESADRYDMILMDVQMPIMNGYEATKKIRLSDYPRAKTIPIVAMTANAFAEDVKNALDAGMDGHLAKPIDMVKVKELIGKLLKDKKDTDIETQEGDKKE